MAKINIGEVLAEGLKAKGIDPNSDAAKKFLMNNQDLGKIEVEDTAIGDIALLTFDSAKTNVGLAKHFEAQVYGGFATDTEKTFLDTAKEFGIDESEAKRILDDRSIKPWERGARITKLIAQKTKEAGGKTTGKEALEAMEAKFNDMVKAKDGELNKIKGEYDSTVGALHQRILSNSLKTELLQGKFGRLNDKLPMFDDLTGVVVNKVLTDNEFEVALDSNNQWSIKDRKTGTVATDPKTGQPIDLKVAVTKYIPESMLLKDNNGGNGGQHRQSAGAESSNPYIEEQRRKAAAMNGL